MGTPLTSLSTRPPFAASAGSLPVTQEVGLFIPPAEDSSNRVLNELAKHIAEETPNVNLVVFLTKPKPDKRVEEIPLLKKARFLHSDILRDVIFPFQRKNKDRIPEDTLLAPDLLAEKYQGRIRLVQVDNPNDPEFIKEHISGNPNLKLALSVRNLIIFKEPIIDAMEKKGENRFLNIHPATLPEIRGLYGPFWTRVLGKDEYTTTMHVIKRKVDTGPIVDYVSKPVNGSATKSTTTYTRDVAPDVAAMIFKHLHLVLVKKARRPAIEQDDTLALPDFSVPTAEEIDTAYKELGIKVVDGTEQMEYLSRVGYGNSDHEEEYTAELTEKLWDAYSAFKLANSDPASKSEPANGNTSQPRQPDSPSQFHAA